MFEVVDTGGLIFDEDQDNLFAPQIREQALLGALAFLCVCVCGGGGGVFGVKCVSHMIVGRPTLYLAHGPINLHTPINSTTPTPHRKHTALDEAVAAIFVVDGQAGMTALDEEIAKFLRLQKGKPIYVAVNKCEQANMGEALASNFWRLGLGTPFPISGLHGSGIAEVLEEMLPHIYHVSFVCLLGFMVWLGWMGGVGLDWIGVEVSRLGGVQWSGHSFQ